MLDLQDPHSAHILQAAFHLDVLIALDWQQAQSQPAAAGAVAALDQLSKAEFAYSRTSIQAQLRCVATCFGLLPEAASPPTPAIALAEALEQLEHDFGTWAI